MREPRLVPSPWWVRKISSGGWMTLSTTIYHPPQVDPTSFPHVIEHERAHSARQQVYGPLKYVLRYLLQPSFRFNEELFGYAVQVAWWMEHGSMAEVNRELTDAVQRLQRHDPSSSLVNLEASLWTWAQRVRQGKTMDWSGGVMG